MDPKEHFGEEIGLLQQIFQQSQILEDFDWTTWGVPLAIHRAIQE